MLSSVFLSDNCWAGTCWNSWNTSVILSWSSSSTAKDHLLLYSSTSANLFGTFAFLVAVSKAPKRKDIRFFHPCPLRASSCLATVFGRSIRVFVLALSLSRDSRSTLGGTKGFTFLLFMDVSPSRVSRVVDGSGATGWAFLVVGHVVLLLCKSTMSSTGVLINARICSSVNVHGGLARTREGAPFLPREPLLRVHSSCEVLLLRCETARSCSSFSLSEPTTSSTSSTSTKNPSKHAISSPHASATSRGSFPWASSSPRSSRSSARQALPPRSRSATRPSW
mmetsp:Transcript_4011/g.25222  ORF Transcript_4011/g.25222 Transcript_4011/m.25222 type:complete len:280 (+) Transcript_4011:2460-3299(+)